MRRLLIVALVFTAIFASLSAQRAWGLATEELGNGPLSELNYTAWKGIVPIVNDKARVYSVWVNGNEHFYYRSGTKEVNAALAHFVKVDVKNHVVALRPGPATRNTLSTKIEVPFNWELHVVGGIAASRAVDDIEDLYWQRDPVLTIFIGGDIDLDKLEIPMSVTLRAAPGESDEAKKNEALQKKIAEFVKSRMSEPKK